MVYTGQEPAYSFRSSAIAEILIWFTPTFNKTNLQQSSAIAEILIWFTPANVFESTHRPSAIAEILIWFTPFVCKGNDFQSFMQVFRKKFTLNMVFQP